LADSGEKFLEFGEAENERDGVAFEIGRERHVRAGDDDRTARGAKIFTEFAEATADFVVLAVAGKVFKEKDGVAVDDGDVSEGLAGIVGVIERLAAKASETFGDAPGIDGDVELGADLIKKLLDSLFFGGLDGDDGMVRVNEETEFVAFVEFTGNWAQDAAPRRQGKRTRILGQALETLRVRHWAQNRVFDFTGSVP